MKRVVLSFFILVLVTVLVTVHGIWIGCTLDGMRSILQDESPDPQKLRNAWNEVSFVLELTASRVDLDAVEEDLLHLEHKEGDPETVIYHMDRSLKRLRDGYVPSFSGVF